MEGGGGGWELKSLRRALFTDSKFVKSMAQSMTR